MTSFRKIILRFSVCYPSLAVPFSLRLRFIYSSKHGKAVGLITFWQIVSIKVIVRCPVSPQHYCWLIDIFVQISLGASHCRYLPFIRLLQLHCSKYFWTMSVVTVG
jgi:hypothetical protein